MNGDSNFAQSIVDRLAQRPRAGLTFVDAVGHRRDYTFAEVADYSQRYAAVFRALGISAGDTAVICNANTARCLFMLLALQRIDAVATLCGPEMSCNDVAARAHSSSASAIVTNRARVEEFDGLRQMLPQQTRFFLAGGEREGWARVDTLADAAKPFAGVDVHEHNAAFFVDGKPLDRSDFLTRVAAASSLLQAERDDRVWSTTPFGTVAWLVLAHAPFYSGAASIACEGAFDANDRIDLVQELDATILCQPAAEYRTMLESPAIGRARWLRLRRCVAIGAADDLARQWEARTGKRLQCVSEDAFG